MAKMGEDEFANVLAQAGQPAFHGLRCAAGVGGEIGCRAAFLVLGCEQCTLGWFEFRECCLKLRGEGALEISRRRIGRWLAPEPMEERGVAGVAPGTIDDARVDDARQPRPESFLLRKARTFDAMRTRACWTASSASALSPCVTVTA